MNTRYLRVRYNNGSEKGKVIRDLCNEVDRLRRKVAIQQHLLTQVIQLQQREKRKTKLRRVV